MRVILLCKSLKSNHRIESKAFHTITTIKENNLCHLKKEKKLVEIFAGTKFSRKIKYPLIIVALGTFYGAFVFDC